MTFSVLRFDDNFMLSAIRSSKPVGLCCSNAALWQIYPEYFLNNNSSRYWPLSDDYGQLVYIHIAIVVPYHNLFFFLLLF